jgi:hypothetical protein
VTPTLHFCPANKMTLFSLNFDSFGSYIGITSCERTEWALQVTLLHLGQCQLVHLLNAKTHASMTKLATHYSEKTYGEGKLTQV